MSIFSKPSKKCIEKCGWFEFKTIDGDGDIVDKGIGRKLFDDSGNYDIERWHPLGWKYCPFCGDKAERVE